MKFNKTLYFIGDIDPAKKYNRGDIGINLETKSIYAYNGIEWLTLGTTKDTKDSKEEEYISFDFYDKSCTHCGASSYNTIKINGHKYVKCNYCGTIYDLERRIPDRASAYF